MKSEKVFMLIFRFTPNFDFQPTDQDKAKMHEQWGNFIGQIAIKEKLISTHQLGFEGKQIRPDLTMVDGILVSDSQTLGGNMIVKANSMEEAVEMAKGCPILLMGGTVEIRNVLPMDE